MTVLLDVFIGRIACSLDFTNVNIPRTLDVPVLTADAVRGICVFLFLLYIIIYIVYTLPMYVYRFSGLDLEHVGK